MVATGPFRSAVMPDIPGMENFKGEMIHVKDYRQQSIFQGKRVLFVGKDLIMFVEKITQLIFLALAGQIYPLLGPNSSTDTWISWIHKKTKIILEQESSIVNCDDTIDWWYFLVILSLLILNNESYFYLRWCYFRCWNCNFVCHRSKAGKLWKYKIFVIM